MSSKAIDSTASPAASRTDKLAQLKLALQTNTLKKQLSAISELAVLGNEGEVALVEFVRLRMDENNPERPTAAHGSAYQYIYQVKSEAAKALTCEFPDGLVSPQSSKGMDYSELHKLLIQRRYQEADKLTNQKLRELAGESAIARKWVYFTEVEQFPALDLMAIDILWGLYSENKFGWSRQYDLWTRLGRDWDRLWPQLSWKNGNAWTRYPNEFIWDLSAPIGHLPLSNQLRGVRTMNAILSHPVWSD